MNKLLIQGVGRPFQRIMTWDDFIRYMWKIRERILWLRWIITGCLKIIILLIWRSQTYLCGFFSNRQSVQKRNWQCVHCNKKQYGKSLKSAKLLTRYEKWNIIEDENSLRIVCTLREATHSVRSIFVYVSVRRGQKSFYPFFKPILYERG